MTAFALVFLLVLFHTVLRNPHGLHAALLVAISLSVLVVMAGVWILLGKFAFSERFGRNILIVYIGIMAVLLLIVGHRLRYTPAWDADAIFSGGRIWAETGMLDRPSEYHASLAAYFAMYSNQLGGVFLSRCVFTIFRWFGGEDYGTAALIYNVAALMVMAGALYDAAKRLLGVRGGLFSLFMLTVFPPFYTFGAVFYTDVMSMPFLAVALALYLRAREEPEIRNKRMLFMACGVVTAMGSAVKFTVMIILIAITLEFLLSPGLTGEWRRLTCIGAAFVTVIVLLSGFYRYMDAKITLELINERRIPKMHWVMMGLEGDGAYNPTDYEFTMNIADPVLREREVRRVTWERIEQLGISGLFRMFTNKAARNFGDGTYALTEFLDDNPLHKSALHNVVLRDGQYFTYYQYLSTGMICALMISMVMGAVMLLCRKDKPYYRGQPQPERHKPYHPGRSQAVRNKPPVCLSVSLVPWLAVLGLLLFLTFWETNPRLILNFLPVMVIGAVLGVSLFTSQTE